MSSLDVRDMLDLPQGGARPTKKIKLAGPRPSGLKGLAREVQSLGGDNPIALVPAIPTFKKRKTISRKAVTKWDLRPFKNSARKDDLVLKHWRRQNVAPLPTPENDETVAPVENDANAVKKDEIEDSMFAKYNVQVNIPTYNDEQYESTLKSRDWTKEETDYLMELVRDFDLRWPIIWDRYEYKPAPPPEADGSSQALVAEPKQRTVEDLKARYYEVAAKMMAVHRKVEHMTQAEFSLHQMMLGFNPAQEALRKRFAEAALSKSIEDRREEEQLLVELKRIIARSEQLNEDRKSLYNTLESRVSNGNIGIYTTSAGLSQLVQQLATADKSKKRKSIMGGPESTPSATPAQNDARRESTATQVAQTPSANKKGPPGPAERKKLTEEEEAIYGVSFHDRLTLGPAFRNEKVSKLTNARSNVVAQRVHNILTELEIPHRLVMPTADVTKEYELLLQNTFKLLDARKLNDKLDGEVKVLENIKAERERKAREAEEAAKVKDEDGVKKEDGEGSMSAPVALDSRKRSGSEVSDNSAKRQKK